MWMYRNLHHHARRLGAMGAILLVASYSFFALLSCFDFAEGKLWLNNLYMYMNYSGIALGSFSLGLQTDSNLLRKLLYYPGALLYLIVVISYAINDIFDIMIQTKIIILPSILLTWICFLLFYRRMRH
jgi:hypothetical protein